MQMFEDAYMIQNKKISPYIKFLFLLFIASFLLILLYQYPKTIYYKGLVIESDGDKYVEILSKETTRFTNIYMKIIIGDKKYKYQIYDIKPVNLNNNLYYQILLKIDKDLLINEELNMNIYLGKTTLLEEFIKNIKKGIIYGQT